MSFNKHLTIVILLLCFLILCNGVYAENTETPTETTNDNIEQTYVTNYNELKNAITNIGPSTNKNHEINLKQDTYNLPRTFNGKINSSTEKNIVINGNHSTINGQNLVGFLTIPRNAKISINNLTITNMKRNIAPAIRNSGQLNLENIIFENNTANYQYDLLGGGTIFTEDTTNITNCTFNNNGGNIDGSAIYIKDNANSDNIINIKNCQFHNNTSLKASTIKTLGYTSTNIINSTFTNENANYSIIENTNTELTINNCTFTNENATTIISNYYNCDINNTIILNNTINTTIITKNNLTLNNTRIYDNKAKNILDYTWNLTIENTIINNNNINESLITGTPNQNENENNTLRTNNVTIANNTAKKTCGIRNEETKSNIFIENSFFVNNTSEYDEGIITDYNGTMHINNSQFHNNTCEDLFKGNTTTFKEVNNNEYLGNLLKIYLKTTSTINDNHLIINGSLETDEIYNTTVSTGKLTLKNDNITVYSEDVTNNKFLINYIINRAPTNLTLSYDGITNFRNTSDDINYTMLKEEYEFEIMNISKNFIYGNYVTFDLFIRNSGNVSVNNIMLSNVLPNELVYIDSSDDFDSINNKYILNTLNINENRTIKFHTLPSQYKTLNLEFNISDNKQDRTYQLFKEVEFISPTIKVNKITAHPGELINVTAKLENYNKSCINNLGFMFNYREVQDFSYTLKDNIIVIENFQLNDTLTRKDYMIKIVCAETNLEEFHDTSLVSVIKYNTHSMLYYNLSNSYLNLSANILDEYDNMVKSGTVILKVNGKSVKTVKVINGIAVLNNFKLASNYNNEYNITLTYTGNNKYNMHINNTTIREDKKTLDFSMNYEINGNNLVLSIRLVCADNVLPESGVVAVKVNEKTIIPKMAVEEEYILTICVDDIPGIHNITVAYYGNENFVSTSKTIGVS